MLDKPLSILDETLRHAVADKETVTADGKPVGHLTHGVSFHEVTTHLDERGSVCEMYDSRWGWHPDPIVFAYTFTLKPNYVKGWNLHKEHEDRYFLLQGEMELVLFDPRPDSPTCGEICRIVLSPHKRGIINVPKFVWHADHNIGTNDVVVVNFPTTPYDHKKPDKYRLPIDTPLIPYSFKGRKGW